MAQTSNRARSRPSGSRRATGSKRSNSSGSKARSSASRSGNGRSSKPRATSRNASGSGRKTSASTRARSRPSPRTKGKAAQKRKSAQGSRATAENGRSTVVKAAEKARVPALAGGVALLGLAGGVALSSRKKRNGILSGIGSKLSLPQPNLAKRLPTPNGSALHLLGDAATEVARGSSKVQGWASQVQKAAETISPESSSDD
jgi:hypothetical protein